MAAPVSIWKRRGFLKDWGWLGGSTVHGLRCDPLSGAKGVADELAEKLSEKDGSNGSIFCLLDQLSLRVQSLQI